jgi:hypothetical protein
MGALGWVVSILFAAHAMGATEIEIAVQVYNRAGAPAKQIRNALGEADWILRQAGIKTHWLDCRDSGGARGDLPACHPRTEPGLFVLSIVSEDPRERGLGDALGFAVLAGGRNGAAVIYSRITSMLQDNPNYAGCNILASVIAHELGHLLLGSPQHGEGIMKANWGAGDFKAMKQRRLTFSPSQARQMRSSAPAQGAPAAISVEDRTEAPAKPWSANTRRTY